MPHLKTPDGAEIFWDSVGAGSETIVFAHSIMWSHKIFEAQIKAFSSRFRCIFFDFRGHGQSSAPLEGYSPAVQADDLRLVLETVLGKNHAPVHLVGAGIGGAAALRFAGFFPEKAKSLTAIGTTACAESAEAKARFRFLNTVVKWLAPRAVMSKVLPLCFGEAFLSDLSRRRELYFWQKEFRANRKKAITRAVDAHLERVEITSAELDRIECPALILAGDDDRLVPMECKKRFEKGIRRARFEVIENCGHLATVERPEAVNRLLEDFFQPFLAKKAEKRLVLEEV